MANNSEVASAAGNCQSNDRKYPDEVIDNLASMFIRNARRCIRDDGLRLRVLARAFVVEYVECRYIRDDPVVVFVEYFDLVESIFQCFKSSSGTKI